MMTNTIILNSDKLSFVHFFDNFSLELKYVEQFFLNEKKCQKIHLHFLHDFEKVNNEVFIQERKEKKIVGHSPSFSTF